MAGAGGFARSPRARMVPTGRRHLGSSRGAPALYLFEGHGLGCVRSCNQKRGNLRTRWPDSPMAGIAGADLRGGMRAGLRCAIRQLRSVIWIETIRRELALAS